MNKYIDAEKLKAEITRIDNEHPVHISERYEDGFDDGYHGCCDEIVAVIDSLQQEQPEVDLEKEIVRYTKKSLLLPITNSITPMDIMETDWIKCARHFAEWGARHLNARKEE